MKFFLLLPVGLTASLIHAVVVSKLLIMLSLDVETSAAVGMAFGAIGLLVCISYGSLRLLSASDFHSLKNGTNSATTARMSRSESKMETAELRVAMVFGFIGGMMAGCAGAPNWLIACSSVGFAVLGGLIGHDLKLRYREIKKRFEESTFV